MEKFIKIEELNDGLKLSTLSIDNTSDFRDFVVAQQPVHDKEDKRLKLLEISFDFSETELELTINNVKLRGLTLELFKQFINQPKST